MIPEHNDADVLADCDDALAAGRSPESVYESAVVSTDVRVRLESGVEWCRMVRQLLTGQNSSVGITSATPRIPAAHLDIAERLGLPEQPGTGGQIGRYAILDHLGSGGMGIVFLAEDSLTGARVAVKVMQPRLLSDSSARERFHREARVAAGLKSDYVVPVLETGEENGVPFLVMPLLDGETLDARLKREAPLPIAEVIRLGSEIAEGLAAAHAAGLIHRDIKPSNIWLASASLHASEAESPTETLPFLSRARILDFGLVRDVDLSTQLTQPGAVLGTPAYMSPEQARGDRVDERSDLFSLGCLLYHMATGRPPFPGANAMAIFRALELHQPVPPHRLRSDVPRPLSQLICALLEKQPERRPTSAKEVSAALLASPEPQRRRRRRLIAAGLLGVAAIAATVAFSLRKPDPPQEPPTSWPGFLPATTFAVGTDPAAAVLADFNGDGVNDLVVSCQGVNGINLLLGQRDGTFHPPTQFPTGRKPRFLAVADFNGDGKPDLAVSHPAEPNEMPLQPGMVRVLLGDGQGGFLQGVAFAGGIDPAGLAAGDVNGDGKPDLVVANTFIEPRGKKGRVEAFLGNGDGTFRSAWAGPEGFFSVVALHDFDGDGRLDVVALDQYCNAVAQFQGRGDGTFELLGSKPVGECPDGMAMADVNGDGRPDLVTSNRFAQSVSVLIGNVDGTFRSAATYPAGHVPTTVVIGDFNGDGKPDLAVGDQEANSLNVLAGNGDGTFQSPIVFSAGKVPRPAAAQDLNGDGAADLVVVHASDHNVGVFLTSPRIAVNAGSEPPGEFPRFVPRTPTLPDDAAFGLPLEFETGARPSCVLATDVNRDGRLDLVVSDMADNTVSVLLGNGDGTMQPAKQFRTGLGPRGLASGDFNGDGKPDLAVTSLRLKDSGARGSVCLLLGNGDGTFRPPVEFDAGPHPSLLVADDFNRDGLTDLAVLDGFHVGSVCMLLGQGDGTFRKPVLFPAGVHPSAFAAADLNGDGHLDLVLPTATSKTVAVLLGTGDGTFRPRTDYIAESGPQCGVLGDFTGRGRQDLAIAAPGRVSLWKGNGDGTFQTGSDTPIAEIGLGMTVADFDGDGRVDVAVNSRVDLCVLRGLGEAGFAPARRYPVGHGIHFIASGDFNGDGKPDLVATRNWANKVSVLLNQSRGSTPR